MHTSARTRIRTSLLWLIAALAATACTEAGAWDMIRLESESPTRLGSMEITVDGSMVTEFIYDVPVLVKLEEPMFDYSVSRLEGRDIDFYPEPFEPGMRPMDHVLAAWDPAGTSYFWVRVPLITPGNSVTFHMQVGNNDTAVSENPEGVWRNGYAAVLGFDDPDARYADATQFRNDGSVSVNGQTEPIIDSGVVGPGVRFERNTDAVLIPDSDTMRSLTPVTVSLWVRVPMGVSSGRLISKSQRFLSVKPRSGGTEWEFQSRIKHTATPPVDDGDFNDVFNAWVGTTPVPGAWTNITLRWSGEVDSNRLSLFVDGVAATAFNPNGSAAGSLVSDAGSLLAIGNGAWFGAESAFSGRMDQVELSFVDRSADWIKFHVDTVQQTIMGYGPLIQ